MIPLESTIDTARLRLQRPTQEDIPHVFSATRYPNFNDGMPWEPPVSLDELQAPLERSRLAWESGKGYAFTLKRKEDAAFIGRISIRKTDEVDIWNIGFWTHPSQQKQGYMTEAVAAILDFGFQQLGAIRIEAEYATWNKASEAVLLRNGLTFVKFIEQGFQKNDEWVPENRYAIDRPEHA